MVHMIVESDSRVSLRPKLFQSKPLAGSSRQSTATPVQVCQVTETGRDRTSRTFRSRSVTDVREHRGFCSSPSRPLNHVQHLRPE
jgi:hypothetical protein